MLNTKVSIQLFRGSSLSQDNCGTHFSFHLIPFGELPPVPLPGTPLLRLYPPAPAQLLLNIVAMLNIAYLSPCVRAEYTLRADSG